VRDSPLCPRNSSRSRDRHPCRARGGGIEGYSPAPLRSTAARPLAGHPHPIRFARVGITAEARHPPDDPARLRTGEVRVESASGPRSRPLCPPRNVGRAPPGNGFRNSMRPRGCWPAPAPRRACGRTGRRLPDRAAYLATGHTTDISLDRAARVRDAIRPKSDHTPFESALPDEAFELTGQPKWKGKKTPKSRECHGAAGN
jgi:hypothetical protein